MNSNLIERNLTGQFQLFGLCNCICLKRHGLPAIETPSWRVNPNKIDFFRYVWNFSHLKVYLFLLRLVKSTCLDGTSAVPSITLRFFWVMAPARFLFIFCFSVHSVRFKIWVQNFMNKSYQVNNYLYIWNFNF